MFTMQHIDTLSDTGFVVINGDGRAIDSTFAGTIDESIRKIQRTRGDDWRHLGRLGFDCIAVVRVGNGYRRAEMLQQVA